MWIKVLLLFFTFSFLFRTDESLNQDLGRHLKMGEVIVKWGSIPNTNLFSYTNPDFSYVNTHWLFGAMAYLISSSFGIYPLLILKVIIILMSVFLTLKLIPKENQTILLPIGFIFLHVLRERTDLRPEIFSFLFTSITLFILYKFIEDKNIKLAIFLPLVQLIWINTHIYFFVGLVLQAIFLIYMVYKSLRLHLPAGRHGPKGAGTKLLGIIFILSVLLSLLNPNGLNGLLYPLNVTKNYGYTIVENQTMFFLENISFKNPNFLFVKISAVIIVFGIILSLTRRRFSFINSLISSLGLGLALIHVRSFPYLLFLSLPATLQNFGPLKFNILARILTIVFVIMLILESYFYLSGDYYRFRDDYHKKGLNYSENGKGALDFVLDKNLPSPLFNNFDIGSYIIYRAYPELKVFVDGRPEAYPVEFFTGTYIPAQSDYKNFKELEKIYQIKTIIFSHTDQTPWGQNFLKSIIKDEDWRLVYIDDFMLILIRKEFLDENKLDSIDLSKLNPNTYKFDTHLPYLRIGLFLLNNQFQNGILFIQKSLQIFPNSGVANSVMGNLTGQSIFLDKSKNNFFW